MAAQSIDRSLEISEAVCAVCNQDFPARPGVSICALCRAQGHREPVPAPVAAWTQTPYGNAPTVAQIAAVAVPAAVAPAPVSAAMTVQAAVAAVLVAPPAAVVPGPDQGGPVNARARYAPGWVAMMARKDGPCAGCGFPIQVSDSIGYHYGIYKARHDRCVPRVPEMATPAPFAAPVVAPPAPDRMTSAEANARTARPYGTVYRVEAPVDAIDVTHPWRVQGHSGRYSSESVARDAAGPAPAGAVAILDMVPPAAVTPPAAPVGPRDPNTLWERVPARETAPAAPPAPSLDQLAAERPAVPARAPVTYTAAGRAREAARAAARPAVTPAAPVAIPAAPLSGVLADAELNRIARRAGEDGAMVGWSGKNRPALSRADILAALAAAGLPASWAPPSAKAVAILGDAVRSAKGDWSSRAAVAAGRSIRDRGWKARHVLAPSAAAVADLGDSIGDAGVIVWLDEYDGFHARHEPTPTAARIAAAIQAEYQTRAALVTYDPGDVTIWLQGLLTGQWGALGAEWYIWVPIRYRADLDRLLAALGQVWGRPITAKNVITDADLRAGLVAGLVSDVAALAKGWRDHVAECRDASPSVSPSTTRASTLAAKLDTDIASRAKGHADMLGVAAVAEVRAAIAALAEEVQPYATDAARRLALCWAENK